MLQIKTAHGIGWMIRRVRKALQPLNTHQSQPYNSLFYFEQFKMHITHYATQNVLAHDMDEEVKTYCYEDISHDLVSYYGYRCLNDRIYRKAI